MGRRLIHGCRVAGLLIGTPGKDGPVLSESLSMSPSFPFLDRSTRGFRDGSRPIPTTGRQAWLFSPSVGDRNHTNQQAVNRIRCTSKGPVAGSRASPRVR